VVVDIIGPCAALCRVLSVPGGDGAVLLVVKQTVHLMGGRLVPKPGGEQIPVFTEDREVDGRICGADFSLPKQGADLVVIGDVLAPAGRPVTELEVNISWGRFRRRLLIFGNRYWRTRDPAGDRLDESPLSPKALEAFLEEVDVGPEDDKTQVFSSASFRVPRPSSASAAQDASDRSHEVQKRDRDHYMSEPIPFVRMPLTWGRSFGGTADYGMVFGDNPQGRGYIVPPFQKGVLPRVAGVRLPNVEAPDRRIRRWTDRPSPAGCAFYPRNWGLRLRRGLSLEGGTPMSPPRMTARLYNQSHPDFELDGFPDGQTLTITHMSAPDPVFSAAVDRPRLSALIKTEKRPLREISLVWDLLCVRPETQDGYIVGRALFGFNPAVMAGARVQVVQKEDQS
jgi:hypothetical protein